MRDQLAKLRREYDANVKSAETAALKKASAVRIVQSPKG